MRTTPAWALGARQGPLRRHRRIVFFAVEGLVSLYDEREQEETYRVITPRDFQERAYGLAALATKMVKGPEKWMRSDGRASLLAARNMMATVREARDMGDPSDPAVQAYWAKHRRNRMIRVSLSAGSDVAGYPTLPQIPLGRDTGRRAAAGLPLAAADTAGAARLDAAGNKIRRKPRKTASRGRLLLPADLL